MTNRKRLDVSFVSFSTQAHGGGNIQRLHPYKCVGGIYAGYPHPHPTTFFKLYLLLFMHVSKRITTCCKKTCPRPCPRDTDGSCKPFPKPETQPITPGRFGQDYFARKLSYHPRDMTMNTYMCIYIYMYAHCMRKGPTPKHASVYNCMCACARMKHTEESHANEHATEHAGHFVCVHVQAHKM